MSVDSSGSSIIVALDGSAADRLVLAQAKVMAAAFGAGLVLVRAAGSATTPPSVGSDAATVPATMTPIGSTNAGAVVATPEPVLNSAAPQPVEDTDATGSLNILSNELAETGLQVESVEPTDDLAASLSQYARMRNARMIILAHRRHEGGLGRLFGGSSDNIPRDAPCPILLIPGE